MNNPCLPESSTPIDNIPLLSEVLSIENSHSRNTERDKKLKQFLFQTSKINFTPIPCFENKPGNYDYYVQETLSHIIQLRKIKLNYALESSSLYDNMSFDVIERIASSNKKFALLDLDETLVHADFNDEFADDEKIQYDTVISFYSDCDNNLKDEENDMNTTSDDIKAEKSSKILNKVGVFLRPGLEKFLEEISKYFEIGIFTASVPEYADAVLNYIDPEKKYFKIRLYRNNCVDICDLLRIKDLRILKKINLKNVVLIDNNMYSFAPQLSNGILINSFYCDKTDCELSNVSTYLINYIAAAEDVRKINEKFFGFKQIAEDLAKNLKED